jgi:predicted nucleic acid-binding protein
MTLVVSDASPLNYLVLVGVEQILPELYSTILVPAQVIEELLHDETPEVVRSCWPKLGRRKLARFGT